MHTINEFDFDSDTDFSTLKHEITLFDIALGSVSAATNMYNHQFLREHKTQTSSHIVKSNIISFWWDNQTENSNYREH